MEIENDMLTVEGFNRQYEVNLPGKTQQAAYEATEVVFYQRHNHRRYSDFHSFRNSRNQWLNIRKKNREAGRQAA